MPTHRSLRSAAAQPAHLGDRPVQPALPVLHAGDGLRVAAARERAHLRGDRDARRTCSPISASIASGSPAASRCCAATCRRWSRRSPRKPAIADLALTTNGVLLARHAAALRRAGLHRITVSLDTLAARALQRADPLRRARRPCWPASTPRSAGFAPLKIDTVVIRGVNDDELVPLLEFGRSRRRRGALHRIHGRRRRHALVAGRGRLARGDAGAVWRRSTARLQPVGRRNVGARRSASGCRTGRRSGSSRRRPSRSARPAIAAG